MANRPLVSSTLYKCSYKNRAKLLQRTYKNELFSAILLFIISTIAY